MRVFLVMLVLMTTGFAAAAARIQVHGHRGARAVLPENTIPAFEYAIKQGVDALELDLAVTRDNVLVVSHDPLLNPGICAGPGGSNVIRELTLEQVKRWDCGALPNREFPKQTAAPGTRVPTLDEVFALAALGGFEFNVETKIDPRKPQFAPSPEDFARLLLDAIRRHGLERRVIVQSFDFRTLHALKSLAPDIRLSALYGGFPKDYVKIARESGAGIVSPHWRLVSKGRVKSAHAAGLQVIPWTANKPSEWRKLVDAGVDAIITDDPAELISWLKSQGLR
jgi:glycerophosphoryl diester phosphodiesterase